MIGCSDLLVKVCGLTRQEDADLCAELSVQFSGFIFHQASPRYVSPDVVRSIRAHNMMRVGVFVNHSLDEVRSVMEQAGLHLAQLHGDQDPDFCRALGRDKVIKAFWPEGYDSRDAFLNDIERYKEHIRLCLFDSGVSGGGHGVSFDHSLLTDLNIDKTWFIAGGLGPETLPLALRHMNPCGIDINSGVESAPGVKDPDKLRAVMRFVCSKQ